MKQTDKLKMTHTIHSSSSALYECSSEVLCASVVVKSGLENRDYGRRGYATLTM
jgi:hypothetical protein